ncbi:hypothetical protein D8B26_002192 [Coccidioides posadasii str. Silveira]|uniref:Uncharacterized protein n=3 Tax=Coccidioides posadasii TaxID=199306 RepID=E9DDL5_COCPS|nr:yeast cell wall synthesis domain KRE9/KNH1 containing protein [Coccidioides posadasii C735 delta SOWgp]EER24023.1 yeast cell wall synthesis domain KRE9/KNH1 containing protein [Coccidioides posadasii C735 delta SOWgp]EFW15740.1 conserved hypothetical protein [Coccidioides posadasii str. Silveira]KMM65572.1 hypothetical protein CPAG_01918 [Coccidioides posadasii RMSCC 3488]QVM07493.1 hypothetical protein D8B26_002192 [Coccidioides posadasii str. Silveira]|eukprot:XP_003066168.1 yeast cell wall synthesis domain KRE9/KNH1 containing protein [Coccidioides posadasii C735 delta SOWgp]
MKLKLFYTPLLFLASPLRAVASPVQFARPTAGAVTYGGKPLHVEWKYSEGPETQLESKQYNLYLCAGGNDIDTYEPLMPLVEQGLLQEMNSFSAVVDPKLGGESPNAYFLQFSVEASNGTISFYSHRFTISGMTGAFPPHIAAALKAISGTTTGPRTFNNLHKRQVGAVPPGAQADLPYNEQTGPTRYAPVPKPPPTKITLKSAAPLFPTSEYKIATTKLPVAKVMTTISRPPVETVKQIENTAAAADHEDDEMQRFLKRWQD